MECGALIQGLSRCHHRARLPILWPSSGADQGRNRSRHQTLVDDIEENYLGGANILSAKSCLRGLYSLKSLLANLEGDIAFILELFEALHSFYLDASLYQRANLPSESWFIDIRSWDPSSILWLRRWRLYSKILEPRHPTRHLKLKMVCGAVPCLKISVRLKTSIGWFKRTELEALLISRALSWPQNHG